MNAMYEYRDAQLIVVGDCMSQFFGGHDGMDNSLPDVLLPNIRSKHLGSITAWSLMEEQSSMNGRKLVLGTIDSLNEIGYTGWLMLSFGYADLNCHVMKHAIEYGIVTAVRNTVDRYVAFIEQAKARFPKLAIWGPPPTTPRELIPLYESMHHEAPRIGTDVERNYATMLFNKMISTALEMRGIPYLSLFDAAVLANGRSNPRYLYDGCRFGQVMMPLALDLLEQRLGVVAPRGAFHPTMTTQRICLTAFPELTEFKPDTWLCVAMPQIHFIERMTITMPLSERLGDVYAVAGEKNFGPRSADDGTLIGQDLFAQANVPITFGVQATARYIWLRFSETAHVPTTTELFGPVLTFFADESPFAPDSHVLKHAVEIVTEPQAPLPEQFLSNLTGSVAPAQLVPSAR